MREYLNAPNLTTLTEAVTGAVEGRIDCSILRLRVAEYINIFACRLSCIRIHTAVSEGLNRQSSLGHVLGAKPSPERASAYAQQLCSLRPVSGHLFPHLAHDFLFDLLETSSNRD